MRRLRGRGRERDAGAVAVFTAILAVVILVVSALAVEVTNLYATDRASQRSVDLAATSAAQFLPDTCSAVNEAYRAMRDNPIPDTPATPTLPTMVDGNPVNGEIQVLLDMEEAPVPFGTNAVAARGAGQWVDASGCAEVARPGIAQADAARGRPRMVRVMSPTAEIPFRLGRAFTLNPVNADEVPESLTSIRMATAGIVGSSRGLGYGLMPVALPAGCIDKLGYGPLTVITAPPTSPEGIVFSPRGDDTNGPRLAPPNDGENSPIAYFFDASEIAPGTKTVEFLITNLKTDPALPTGVISAEMYTNPTGVRRDSVRLPLDKRSFLPTVNVSAAPAPMGTFAARIRLQLPSQMQAPAGLWLVRVAQLNATTMPHRAWTGLGSEGEIFVDSEVRQGGACDEPNQGNFGLLRTEREGESGVQLDINIARGLDHTLTAFPQGTLTGARPSICTDDGSPAGAILDNIPPRNGPVDGANCVAIESGKPAGPITNGLIAGTTGNPRYPGRLARTEDFVPARPCQRPTGSSSNFLYETPARGEVTVINSVLSCYLTDNATLAKVKAGVPGSLTEDIYADPRFFFIPVLRTADRPPNSSNYYAIEAFVGGFITDEDINRRATCNSGRKGTSCNGISFGSQTVLSLTTFVFPVSALPAQTTLPVDEGPDGFEDFIAGTKEIVLFE